MSSEKGMEHRVSRLRLRASTRQRGQTTEDGGQQDDTVTGRDGEGEIRGQMTDDRRQMTEERDQRSEIRGQIVEI